jgi:adenosylcobinamide-phosphate synthase
LFAATSRAEWNPPPLEGHIVDTAGALTPDQARRIDAKLERARRETGFAVVVYLLRVLPEGMPIEDVAYKAFNTADSLIGHREPRWRMFGWAAARGDDLLNLIPARLAGLLIAAAGGRGFGVMGRDASRHASPNAGWPEAAMAGALRVELGGATTYDGVLHHRPTFGAGPRPQPSDLRRALRIYLTACALLWALALALAFGVT